MNVSHRCRITGYDHTTMNRIFHPLLALIASATDRELVRYVEFLKAENQILRSRIKGQGQRFKGTVEPSEENLSSENRGDGVTVADLEGAAFEVVDFLVGIQAAGLTEGGEIVARGNGVVLDVGGLFIGGAVDGTTPDATTCKDPRVTEGPVIAAVVAIDAGSASEFSDASDDCLFEHAALGEVFQKGAVRLIEGWETVVCGDLLVTVHPPFKII